MASGYVQHGYLIILWKENLGYQALNSVQKIMQLTVDRIIRPQFERIQLPKRLSLLLGDSRYIGKKPVKNCLNARAKMTSDKFDDERLLARKTNENKMKNG